MPVAFLTAEQRHNYARQVGRPPSERLITWLTPMAQFATLVVVAIALLWPAPITTNMLFAAWTGSDLMISHWPTALLIQRTFTQSHTLPLWNPYFGGGQPLGADPLAALFYPPTHLVHFFSLRNYYLVLILAHLIWAGLGVLCLARKALRLPRLPALLAAVSYMATPRLLAHLGAGHVTLVQTITWYPWLALACWATVREPRRRGALLGVCIAMTLLAGHPQMAYYGLLMASALAAWLLFARWRKDGWRSLFAPVAGLAAAALIGGLLAAVHLLPLLEFTARSTRQLSLSSRDAYAVLPFLHSLLFQPPGGGSIWEGLISPGLAVFVLAMLGVVTRWRRAWPLALVIVLVGAMALGVALPFYIAAAHLLPGLDRFRVPTRIWFVALMLIALLAGLGADALLTGIRRVAWHASGRERGALPGVVAAAVGVLVVLLVALSLVVSESGYTRTGDVDAVAKPSALTRTAVRLAGSGRIYGVQENIPQANAVQLQVRLADGWDPLLIESYVKYMNLAGGYSISGYQLHVPPYDSPSVKPNATLLGLMNVSVVVSRRPLTDPHLVRVGEADGTLIYRNTADAGPAYLVGPGTGGNPPSPGHFQIIDARMRIVTLAPEQETFTFSSSTTAYLVVATPAFPGWVAELDGHIASVQLFAGVMPAIKVGPGTHTLSYSYAPSSVHTGAVLSALGLLAALVWLIVGRFVIKR